MHIKKILVALIFIILPHYNQAMDLSLKNSLTNIQTDECAHFQLLQQIFKAANETCETLALPYSIIKPLETETPNPCFYQTNQGFFFVMRANEGILATPWGQISLFNVDIGKWRYGYEAFCQVLFKRLKTSFERFDGSKKYFFEILPENQIELKNSLTATSYKDLPSLKSLFKSLTITEVQEKKETETLIFSSDAGTTLIYKIHAINEQLTPKPSWKIYKNYYDIDTTKIIWKILQDQYTNNGVNQAKY